MLRKAGYLIAFSIPCLTVVTWHLGPWWPLLVPAFVFGAVPFLDVLLGVDTHNPDEAEVRGLSNDPFYRWITWLYVPAQWVLLVWAASVVAQGEGPVPFFTFSLAMAVTTGGVGITVAHELGHRSGKHEQWLAQALLMNVCYMHFFVEHNQGHHRNVATSADPASSRFNESFYRFLPRTLVGGWRSALQIVGRSLARRNTSVYSWRNPMWWYTLLPLGFALALGVLWGPIAVGFFFLQSFLAVCLLEVINYVEHYGLVRRARDDGKFEKVQRWHSWNASQRLTNFFLFNLQRHSDHHASANRRYQTLRHFDDVPQLPTGYAGMIWLALIPPLWFKIMNPKVVRLRLQATQG